MRKLKEIMEKAKKESPRYEEEHKKIDKEEKAEKAEKVSMYLLKKNLKRSNISEEFRKK